MVTILAGSGKKGAPQSYYTAAKQASSTHPGFPDAVDEAIGAEESVINKADLIADLSVEAQRNVAKMVAGLQASERLLVITGAGISVDSGLPVYRDQHRQWQHTKPMQYQDFMSGEAHRQRYWMGSYLGWPKFSSASPNAAHRELAAWEKQGRLQGVITQNVDGLHQQAGSEQVIDLHGRLDRVVCLHCGHTVHRESLQAEMVERYGEPSHHAQTVRPDGDAIPEARLAEQFIVPSCERCGGVIKPDVVFFGENIPPVRKQKADDWLATADALLIVGSSLSVFSGYRFAREAAKQGKPVYCINIGETRADGLFRTKLNRSAIEGLSILS